MNLLNFTKDLLLAFTALFPVVNPIGGASIFLTLTQRYPQRLRRILVRKIALYSFAILAVSLVFGTAILRFFGISVAVIQIAGGLVLAVTGWDLLTRKVDDAASREAPASLEDALQHAFFPLTLPITIGPGTISIAITLGTQFRRENGQGLQEIPGHFLAALVGIFVLCALILASYRNADRLSRSLGKTGTTIVTRLSAFILFTIGVQIIWNGLGAGLPEIIRAVTAH